LQYVARKIGKLKHKRYEWLRGKWRAFGWAASADQPDAAPEVRVRTFIRAFLEHSASRPYLARIVTMESATASERLDYLYDQFIDPIRSRFVPILQGMRHSSKSNADVMEVVYYLITAGGTAPFEQVPMSARMGVHFDPADVDGDSSAGGRSGQTGGEQLRGSDLVAAERARDQSGHQGIRQTSWDACLMGFVS